MVPIMLTKSYLWKLLKNGELRDIQIQGPYYDNFKLEEGPWSTVEEAEAELERYYERHSKHYDLSYSEEFVLLTVYGVK